MAKQEELTRFYMSNTQLKDSAGNVDKSALKDWNAQVRQMTLALESATNGLVKVIKTIDVNGNALATFDVKRSQTGNAQPTFDRVLGDIETRYGYQAGSLVIDPYAAGLNKTENFRRISFHKSFHGALAQKTAKDAVEAVGGTAVSDPSKKMKDRMKIDFAVSENEWNQALQNAGGDAKKANASLSDKFIRRNLKQAEKYSDDVQANQKEKDEERQRGKEEREDKSNKRKMLHWLTIVVSFLAGIADITRRILTASLARASEIKKEQVEAKSLGISYTNAREYKAQETAMGMKEGTFTSAIASLQSAFGDVTHLDDNALGELAKVLKGDVVEAINNGLGRSDPEKLMKTILNTYYERGQSGVNSIGQQVGRYQAERELATALEKAGLNDLANILRNMFYTNDTGIYKDRISTDDSFADYMGLITAYTMGFGGADNKHFSELGAVVDSVKSKFESLKDSLNKLVLDSIGGLIQKIDNWDIGKSEKEKSEENVSNVELNKKASAKMKSLAETSLFSANKAFTDAGVDFSSFGEGATLDSVVAQLNKTGWITSSLSDAQKETYNAMVQFAKTDKGKKAIYALTTAQIATNKANQAETAIIEGRRKGNVKYNKADYTDAALQSAVEDSVADFYTMEERKRTSNANLNYNTVDLGMYDIPALGLLNKATIGGYDYSSASVYAQIANEFYRGENLTYEDALENKSASALTNALYDKLPENKRAKRGLFGVSQKAKEEAVRKALAEGVLSESDVYGFMSENVSEGWGFSREQLNRVKKLFNELDTNKAGEVAAVNNVLSEALGRQKAKDFLAKHNAEGVAGKVYGYNEKEGSVKVVLFVKGGDKDSPKEVLSFYTDAVLGENKTYPIDLDNMGNVVNNAQNRRATR